MVEQIGFIYLFENAFFTQRNNIVFNASKLDHTIWNKLDQQFINLTIKHCTLYISGNCKFATHQRYKTA